MAVQVPGISTLGVKFGFNVETAAGTKPTAYKWLERCNAIAGITLTTENIDASALEDLQTRNIPGRQDTGGTWEVTFNYTDEVRKQLLQMIKLANDGKAKSLNTYYEVWFPSLPTQGFIIKAQPPQLLPMPEVAQNGLQTIALTFTIDEYLGQMAGVEPAEWASEWQNYEAAPAKQNRFNTEEA